MWYVYAIAASLLLLAVFLALTRYETAQGVRFLANVRGQLDRGVERVEFILAHVDLAAFLRSELEHAARRVSHELAHLSLVAVRAVERVLTRLVRRLRMHGELSVTPSREASRDFVKKLSDFKGRLKETRPDVPDIHSVE